MTQENFDDFWYMVGIVGNQMDGMEEFRKEMERLARLGAAVAAMPVNGCAARIDETTWALYETGRDMEDGNSFTYAKLT